MNVINVTYYFAIVATTIVLIWGLRLISAALAAPSKDSKRTLVTSVLSEPPSPDVPIDDAKGSFSRTAGAFGAIGMAAMTIGVGYWVIYALFWDKDSLPKLKDAAWYFLAGSALFFPYAFNQLSKIFKG